MQAYEFETNITSDTLHIPFPYSEQFKTGEIVKVIILRQETTANTIQEGIQKQWSEQFLTWVNSHQNQNLPLLSDIDISRESIYQEGK